LRGCKPAGQITTYSDAGITAFGRSASMADSLAADDPGSWPLSAAPRPDAKYLWDNLFQTPADAGETSNPA
jgi:hypothetical protein